VRRPRSHDRQGGISRHACGRLLSASEYNNIPSEAWLVDFSQSIPDEFPKDRKFAVRCVR
jgi:hypothetical protein